MSRTGLTLGVFGTAKSGKSEIINVLLGRKLLPTDSQDAGRSLWVLRREERHFGLEICARQPSWTPGFYDFDDEAGLALRLQSLAGFASVAQQLGIRLDAARLHVSVDVSQAGQFLCASPAWPLRLIEVPSSMARGLEPWVEDALPVLVVDASRLSFFEEIDAVATSLVMHSKKMRSGCPVVVLVNKADSRTSEDRSLEASVASVTLLLQRRLPGSRIELVPVSAAVCLVGTELLRAGTSSRSISPTQSHWLRERCRSALRNHGGPLAASAGRDQRRWLRAFQDRVEEDAPLERADLQKFAVLCLECGNAEALKRAVQHLVGFADGEDAIRPAGDDRAPVPNLELTPQMAFARLNVVSHLLDAAVVADGSAAQGQKGALAALLIRAYASQQLGLPKDFQIAPFVPKGLPTSPASALVALRDFNGSPEDFGWFIHMLFAMAGVDKVLDPRERALVEDALKVLELRGASLERVV